MNKINVWDEGDHVRLCIPSKHGGHDVFRVVGSTRVAQSLSEALNFVVPGCAELKNPVAQPNANATTVFSGFTPYTGDGGRLEQAEEVVSAHEKRLAEVEKRIAEFDSRLDDSHGYFNRRFAALTLSDKPAPTYSFGRTFIKGIFCASTRPQCPECNGIGWQSHRSGALCAACDGAGTVAEVIRPKPTYTAGNFTVTDPNQPKSAVDVAIEIADGQLWRFENTSIEGWTATELGRVIAYREAKEKGGNR